MRVIDLLAHEYGWSEPTILGMTIAKIRSYISAVNERRKSEFRRTVSLQEWSTRILAQVSASAGGAKQSDLAQMMRDIVFPWGDEDETQPAQVDDPNDLSYLETGDSRAAEKNAGKNLGSLGLGMV